MAHVDHVHHGPDDHTHAPVHQPAMFEPERRGAAWIRPAIAGGTLLAATAYTWAFDPNSPGHFPVCPLKWATGLDCPACGGLRGVHALVHGDVARAADHNVLLLVFLPVAVVAWGLWLLRTLGRPVPHLAVSVRTRAALVLFAVAFAVVRNLSWFPGYDFLNSAA